MRVAPEQVDCPAVAGFSAPWDSVGSLIVLCHQVIDKVIQPPASNGGDCVCRKLRLELAAVLGGWHLLSRAVLPKWQRTSRQGAVQQLTRQRVA